MKVTFVPPPAPPSAKISIELPNPSYNKPPQDSMQQLLGAQGLQNSLYTAPVVYHTLTIEQAEALVEMLDKELKKAR